METTKDGFTFKRISTNRVPKSEPSYNRRAVTREEEPEFIFNSLSNGAVPLKPAANLQKSRQNNKPGRAKKGTEAATGKTRRIRQKQPQTKENESNFLFNVLKKRKTIRMDDSIDLSTESVELPDHHMAVATATAPRSRNTTTPSANIPEESVNIVLDTELRLPFPVRQERIKSYDIHTLLKEDNINRLTEECVRFLKDDSEYAREIIRHSRANYFSDVNHRREIETVQSRIGSVGEETDKWSRIYSELTEETARMKMPTICPPSGRDLPSLDKQALIEEFQQKASELKEREEHLRHSFENIKHRSEKLLKNIFGAVEDHKVDALFLLKAMSKLGH